MSSPLLILFTLALGACIGLVFRKLSQNYSLSKTKREPPPVQIVQADPPTIKTPPAAKTPPATATPPASPTIKEGSLHKKARTHPFAHSIGWQKRYFVADGTGLKYYKDETKLSKPHVVVFQCASYATNVITLTLDAGSMYLLADSEQEAASWVAHLTRKPTNNRSAIEKPPPHVSGALPATPEQLELLKTGVVEFRRIAKEEIEKWANEGSELAIAVRDYDRAVERFLWARDFNVTNALAMWRETVRWRQEHNLDTLLDKPYPEAKTIKTVFPGRYHGFDKLGRLLYIEDTGSLDLPALMAITDIDGMMTYHLSTMEFMVKYAFPQSCIVAQDKTMDQITTILNLKGLSVRLLTPLVMKFLKMLMDVDQNYYPECLGKTFIVNAPGIFSMVWKIVKPWLAPRVMSKIEILGEIKEGSTALHALISADQLPTYLGGTCQCVMSKDCPHAPGQLMRDFLHLTELGRIEFDKQRSIPSRKFGFGNV